MKKEITAEFKAAQKVDALARMKMLHLHEDVIKAFEKDGTLYRSEGARLPDGKRIGILYWLTDEEAKMVKEWEQETGNMVYHVIQNRMVFGMCYSFLYVSTYNEDWEAENEDLAAGAPLVYVKNVDDDFCSEYGSIGIEQKFGALVRCA